MLYLYLNDFLFMHYIQDMQSAQDILCYNGLHC